MDDTTYQRMADALFARIEGALEESFAHGQLEELERGASTLTIEPAGHRPIVVSKHAPTKQIWLASPRLGGLHFQHHPTGEWRLPDGRSLLPTLEQELAACGVNVPL